MKKTQLLISRFHPILLLLLLLPSFSSSLLKLNPFCSTFQKGNRNYDFSSTGNPLETGSGMRELVYRVDFDEPFCKEPLIHLGFGGWEFSKEFNKILYVFAQNIGKDGFDLKIQTLLDSKVRGMRVHYLAIQMED